ncbi:MAG: alpha/beta hydrolase [Rhodospirillaceae bacterium]|nr:MAG: alpha/beta hydrolase [Rhodospirillaceae bacterium]
MIERSNYFAAGFALVILFAGTCAFAQQATNDKPTFTPDGVVHVPAFDLPPSGLMSPEAVQITLKARAGVPAINPFGGATIQDMRATTERTVAPSVKAAQQRYDVDVVPQEIAGVKTRIFTPKAGEADSHRVLINLHGGGFMMCAEGCAMVESIPIAAVGRYKVISVDYRQGPENVFPAASEDVATVYKELLKTYRPENIGIYGCSAGGALTAEVEAWLQDKKLPNPGALGIFGSGGIRFGVGDSPYVSAYIDGSFPPPQPGASSAAPMGYFKGAKADDPLVSPALDPHILAKFPPTLIITGNRAPDLSAAIYTHTELVKAGAKGDLIVGEGMGHCYIYQSDMPEARDAYGIITKFFNDNLGPKRSHSPTRS